MNGAQLHLLTVHLPVVGMLAALILMTVALVRDSDGMARTAIGFVVFGTLLAAPAYFSGPHAMEVAQGFASIDEHLVEQHAIAAKAAFFASVLLAAIAERVSGFHFRDLLATRVLEPAGMRDAGVEEGLSFIVPGLANGYRVRLGTYIHANRGGMSQVLGNGGVYGTARDLFRLDRAIRAGTLLSPAARQYMFQKGNGPFAISWQVGEPPTGYPDDLGQLAWARGANAGGYRVQWTRQLEGDAVIILLANQDYSPRHEITAKLFAALHGSPVDLPQTPLSLRALTELEQRGKEAALSLLAQDHWSEDQRAGAVNELVELAHHRIRAQKPATALPLLEIANAVYPDVEGILASKAYAHFKVGEWTAAREEAERTLQLSPSNKDAALVLDEVRNR